MFSGIIEVTSKAVKIVKRGTSLRVSIKTPKKWNLTEGESVSIDGICSTVESIKDGVLSVYYMPETLSKTTAEEFSEDHVFNLERSLTLQSLIGGHLVSGHIDSTATVDSIQKQQDSKILSFKIDKKFTKYIIEKGSIAVNGVSLTVVTVGPNSFTVSLIPYTLTNTNLGQLKIGDRVNIELDQIAKYLEKLVK